MLMGHMDRINMENLDPTQYLINKWKHRIPKGWYGFSCIAPQWVEPIDKMLIKIEQLCPKFEIHQIKEKFGSCRVYLETNSNSSWENEECYAEMDAIEETLKL